MTTLKMSIAMSALVVTLAPAAQAYATFDEQPSPALERLQLALATTLEAPTAYDAEVCEVVIGTGENGAPRIELACAAK